MIYSASIKDFALYSQSTSGCLECFKGHILYFWETYNFSTAIKDRLRKNESV